MMLLMLFTILWTQMVSAESAALHRPVIEINFSEHFQDQKLARALFERAGEKNKLASDYIWKVDSDGALLNPVVLAYRYEGRAVNSTWSCYKMKGIDESQSAHLWMSGTLARYFQVPPDYFCEGQLPFKKGDYEYFITVNTSSWRPLLDAVEAQIRELGQTSEPEYVLYKDNVLLEYRVSRGQDLSCRRLDAIHSKGRRYAEQDLQLWRKNLLPSKNPEEYRMLQNLVVVRCQISINNPWSVTGGAF